MMMSKTARYANKWATLGALFLSVTAQSQDVCSGTDAIAGSVNSVLEAGARVFVLTADSSDHIGGGSLYISCDDGDSWLKHPMIDDGGEGWDAKRPVEQGNISVTAFATRPGGQVLVGLEMGRLLASIDYDATGRIAGIESPPPPPPAEVTAKLSITIENLNGSAAVEAGGKARFRVVVKNNGPDASTDTYVRFGWVRPTVNGGTSSKALELSSTSGNCTVGPNVETACTFGTLDVGQSATIEFGGTTSTDYIGTHSVTATASNAEGAYSSASGSVSSKKSIACFGDCSDSAAGGGGSVGVMLLAVLMLLATFQLGQNVLDSRFFRVAVHQFQSLSITSDGARQISRLREGLAERIMRIH